MGDFIKELNVIDFLGMLLPGSTLLLILGFDYPLSSIVDGYFGADSNGVFKGIVLMVAGYVMGMLIHEFGDLLEIMIWRIPKIDPKTYAAKVFNGKVQIINSLKAEQTHEETGCFYQILSLISVIIALIVLLMPLSGGFLYIESNNIIFKLFSQYLCGFLLIVIVLVVLMSKKIKNSEYNNYVNIVRNSNSYIQIAISNYGNVQKRKIFDGFHVMMRNLLIVFFLLQSHIYFCIINEDRLSKASKLLALYKNVLQNDAYKLVVGAIIVMMAIRCYHYAYLKYKYSFEDYIAMQSS